jgi:hypothetical protein
MKTRSERKLVKCGQKFGSLKSVGHLQYSGTAFQVVRGEPVATSISIRIIVDAAQFRKINPNYARLSIIRAATAGGMIPILSISGLMMGFRLHRRGSTKSRSTTWMLTCKS